MWKIILAAVAVTLVVVYTFGEKVEKPVSSVSQESTEVAYHPDQVAFAVAMCDSDRKWNLKSKEITPAQYMTINCYDRTQWIKFI